MNRQEFDAASRKWEKAIEDVLCDMANATNMDGLPFHIRPDGIVREFNAEQRAMRLSFDAPRGTASLTPYNVDNNPWGMRT